jgi:RHS repeat-associated protein
MLINSSNSIVAKYLYDAFGNILSKSGLLADANLYRFSSKEFHPNSGLVYYLYRYYDPNLQRWPNKDPLYEPGFALLRAATRVNRYRCTGCIGHKTFDSKMLDNEENLFEFVDNDPLMRYDPHGTMPGVAIGLLIEKILAQLAKLAKGASFLELCRCAGCLAALNEQILACQLYSNTDEELVSCICMQLKESTGTMLLCKFCAFGGNPVQWVRDYIGCDSIGE